MVSRLPIPGPSSGKHLGQETGVPSSRNVNSNNASRMDAGWPISQHTGQMSKGSTQVVVKLPRTLFYTLGCV